MVVPVLVRVFVFSPRFLCVLYKKESNENIIIIIPFRRLPLRVDLTREKNTPLKRPDESQHHPQSRRRKKNDQSPIRPRALRTMPGDTKHVQRVRQQRHDRPVTKNRTDTRPGGNNRQKSLQGTETLFTKSASARDAGTVFGEPGETERLEENGESESTETETNAFESGGATGTRGRVGATATTPTTRRIGIGKKRRRKNDDGEEDKE